MEEFWKDYAALDKDTPIPLYFQVKNMVKSKIENGLLKEGDSIPSEAEFCEYLGISRATVRQAITELVAEGYLYRKRAKGTYVAIPKISAGFFNRLESFNTEMKEKGMKPSTKVISISKIEASEDICNKLGLNEQSPLIYLERLRYADGQPVVYVETYLPYHGMELLLEQDFENTVNGIIDILCSDDYGIFGSKAATKVFESSLAGIAENIGKEDISRIMDCFEFKKIICNSIENLDGSEIHNLFKSFALASPTPFIYCTS